jgi:predicted RNA-binding protein with PIN domain
VDLTRARQHLLIVVTRFREHIHRSYIICIVVFDALQATDVADRTQDAPMLRTRSAMAGSVDR